MSDRPVHTDALETLGKIHWRPEKRDAIHLAVEPVEALVTLRPGTRVIVENGKARHSDWDTPEAHGIVDPFLDDPVEPGQKFWLVLFPRTIHSLRHVWTHPAFPDELPSEPEPHELEAARAAIHELAEDLEISDQKLMDGAKEYLEHGTDMYFGYDLNYGWDMRKFWHAYSVVTGRTVPSDMSDSFFRCAC